MSTIERAFLYLRVRVGGVGCQAYSNTNRRTERIENTEDGVEVGRRKAFTGIFSFAILPTQVYVVCILATCRNMLKVKVSTKSKRLRYVPIRKSV